MAGKMNSHVFTVTVVLVCILTPARSSTLQSDIEVLRSLKQSIDPVSIPTYSYLYSWDFTVDPCESTGGFLGILCSFPADNSSNRVIAIDLDAVGYDGFLAAGVGNLSELTTLSLSKNKFRGPVPGCIANLKKLNKLSLSDNFFTGAIPDGITQLKQLKIIDLSQNLLTGSIPRNISGLRSLTHLRLSKNALSGTIPDLSGLWRLNTLDLGFNQLYGNLPKLPASLRTLSLNHNTLSGHISPLKVLKRIRSLDVSDNRLSDRIRQEILTLPEVFRINVSINQFTAIEAIEFTQDSQLQILDAHSNRIRSRLPISLAALEHLRTLDLSHNQFLGPIPNDYGAKLGKSWKHLFLDDNFLIGNLPPQFTKNAATIRGSLAHNCLRCPESVPLCRGGQRRNLECFGQLTVKDEKLL